MEKKQELLNHQIALIAERAVTEAGFVKIPGRCLQFTREVVEQLSDGQDWPLPIGLDAEEAFHRFQRNGWALPSGSASVPGDLLFQVGAGHGKHGHVMVRVIGNRVAENSSVHAGPNDDDARGFRSLAVIGAVSGIVRVPVRK